MIGIGVEYLVSYPPVTIESIFPRTMEGADSGTEGISYPVLVFASSLLMLPVIAVVCYRNRALKPNTLICGTVFFAVGLVVELLNNAPVLARAIPGLPYSPLDNPVALRLLQHDTIDYLALDVVGFSLIFLAALLYANVFWNHRRTISWTAIASVGFFLFHLPLMLTAPQMGLVLISISIILCGAWYALLSRTVVDPVTTDDRLLAVGST